MLSIIIEWEFGGKYLELSPHTHGVHNSDFFVLASLRAPPLGGDNASVVLYTLLTIEHQRISLCYNFTNTPRPVIINAEATKLLLSKCKVI